ncbi:MAG: hypothetical protein ACFCGT_25245 [Sandaracinaceae bacterium]
MLLGLAGGACGASTPEVAVPETPLLGPLSTLAPPEARMVILSRPAELFRRPSTRRILHALWPEAALDGFAARTGVDLRRLDELVVVDHPDGWVALARGGDLDAAFAVREAGERMAPLESSRDAPWPRRVGFLGERRVDLGALSPEVIAWVSGPPSLAAEVYGRAERPAPARDHALGEPEPTSLWRAHGDAPFLLIAPHPLGLPRDSGVGVLLARQEALALSARLAPGPDGGEGDEIALTLDLRGRFPSTATANFLALARSLAATPEGAAVGARDVLDTLALEVGDRRVLLEGRVRTAVLAAGLRVLFVAEIDELLRSGG